MTSPTPWRVLGIDGGATKSTGIVADKDGKTLARCEDGPSNPLVIGADAAAANIIGLIRGCCERAGCRPADLQFAMLGLAGVGDEREREEIGRRVRELLAQEGNSDLRIAIETDARIALEGALEEVAGLVVIAGTGSVVLGKSPSGEFFRAGGWGRVLGDEGGGFSIGREALKAAMREWDGLGSSGCLREMLESRRSLATRDHVIRAVYRDRLDIAGLAPLVLEGAEHGDAACREILEQESASLVDQVHRVFTLIGGRRGTPLVLLGGLIDHETSYSRILSAAILRRCPEVKIQPARRGPAEGAVLMALRQAGKE